MVVRTYEDELEYLEKINDHCWRIKKGFQPNMKVRVILKSDFEKINQILTGPVPRSGFQG